MGRTPLSAITAGAVLAIFCLVTTAPVMAAPKWDHDRRDRHERRDEHERGRKPWHHGPPSWAPAWGYRGHERLRYVHRGREYYAPPSDLVVVGPSGFGACNRNLIGAVLGGGAGAAVGSQFGKGDGRILATVGGAIIGALIGGNIGRAMDQVDQNCIGQALERAPDHSAVTWQNPDNNAQYQVTPMRTWQNNSGQYCREYQTQIVIGGKVEDAYGTACRQPDGSWKKS